MRENLSLPRFMGEEDFPHIAAILTASQNADHLPITITPAEEVEHLRKTRSFDPYTLLKTGTSGQGFGRLPGKSVPERWSAA